MKLPLPFLTDAFAPPVGMSFDARWVHVAQASVRGGVRTLVGATRVARDETAPGEPLAPLSAAEVARVVEAMALKEIHGKQIALAAPAPFAALTAIELPPRSSGAPLDQIATMELSRVLRLEPGSFELSLWELPKVLQRTGKAGSGSFVAATASHASGEALSAAFDTSGLAVMSLVPEALAIARAASALPSVRAVVSLTWSSMEIVVLDEGSRVVYHRALPELGLHRVHASTSDRSPLSALALQGVLAALTAGERSPGGEPLADGLATLASSVSRSVVEHADFMATEVERSLAYSSRFSPECEQVPIRMVGEGATVAGLSNRLAMQLGMDVVPLGCEELVAMGGGVTGGHATPGLVAAVGASLWTQDVAGRKAA
jgi:Tfp pilus assembly PilM family ATPase